MKADKYKKQIPKNGVKRSPSVFGDTPELPIGPVSDPAGRHDI